MFDGTQKAYAFCLSPHGFPFSRTNLLSFLFFFPFRLPFCAAGAQKAYAFCLSPQLFPFSRTNLLLFLFFFPFRVQFCSTGPKKRTLFAFLLKLFPFSGPICSHSCSFSPSGCHLVLPETKSVRFLPFSSNYSLSLDKFALIPFLFPLPATILCCWSPKSVRFLPFSSIIPFL